LRRFMAAFVLASVAAGADAQTPPHTPAPVAWDTVLGRVAYTDEDGPNGVLEYPLPFGDAVGRFYVDGLAGEFGGPGPLKGYWSEPDVSHDDEDDATLACPFPIIDGHGRTTRNWGRLVIVFTEPDFPSDFVMLRARCFEDPNEVVTGKLAPG
jgi:hypothetical protein